MFFSKRHSFVNSRRGFTRLDVAILLGSFLILCIAFVIGAHTLARVESDTLLPGLKLALPKESADWQMLKSLDSHTASARYVMKSDMTKSVTVSYMMDMGAYRAIYDILKGMPPSAPPDTKINQSNYLEYVKTNHAVYGEHDTQSYLVVFVGSLPVMLQANGLSKDALMEFANNQIPFEKLAALDQARLVPVFLR